MKRIHQDVWCGAFLLGLVAFAYFTSLDIAREDTRSVVMPYIAMGIIAFLAILVIASGIRKTAEAKAKNERPKQYFTRQNLKVPMTAFAMIFGYILAFRYVGYMIATPIFLVSLMLYFKKRDWKVILTIVAVYMLVVYFGFYKALHVNIFNLGELQYLLR